MSDRRGAAYELPAGATLIELIGNVRMPDGEVQGYSSGEDTFEVEPDEQTIIIVRFQKVKPDVQPSWRRWLRRIDL